MAETWPLSKLIAEYRPGSQGDDWTWEDEIEHLLHSGEHRATTFALVSRIAAHGQREPVLLGSDGRVWDGHHRIAALTHLRATTVLVEEVTDG